VTVVLPDPVPPAIPIMSGCIMDLWKILGEVLLSAENICDKSGTINVLGY